MQKPRPTTLIAFAAGSAVTILLSLSLLHRESSSSREMRSTLSAGAVDESDSGKGDYAEIERLRAELQRRSLAQLVPTIAQTESDTNREAPTVPDPSLSALDPVVMACDALDQRMLLAPVDGRKSGELQQAISGMLDTISIPSTSVASTHCGSTLCKVVLRNAAPSELDSVVRKVSQNTPKLFGGVAVYASDSNEKSLYFSREARDLQLAPVEDERKIYRVVVPPQQPSATLAQQREAGISK